MRSRTQLAVGLAVMMVGCTDPGGGQELPPNAQLVPSAPVVIDLATANTSGIATASRRVIADETSWKSAWTEIHRARQPEPERPVLDFSKTVVLLAAMGTRSTGGYTIAIEGVYQANGRLYVVVREKSPGNGCLTTQALTAPVTIVSTGRTGEPVTFVERRETVTC
jgi:hypothetical protein